MKREGDVGIVIGAKAVGFEFKRDEPIERALKRILREEIDHVLTALTGRRRLSRDNAVHEARKHLKKIRSLLKLARSAIGKKHSWREDVVIRDAGRALANSRDAKALLDALELLIESAETDNLPIPIVALRAKLLARRRAALRQQREFANGDVVQCLRAAKRRWNQWVFNAKDFTVLRSGLKRVYRRGRGAFAIARYDRDPDTLHDWRKRVKDLQLIAQLLKPIWPAVLERFAAKAHELANRLGEDHDLFVLRQYLLQEGAGATTPLEIEALFEAIDDRRRKLQQTAMTLGDRVYAEKPADFVERMQNYWNAWSSGQTTQPD